MIQRIQTIFLLIVGINMLVFLFAPLWQKVDSSSGASYTLTAFYLETITSPEEGVKNEFRPICCPRHFRTFVCLRGFYFYWNV